jgi:hypothetical protein
MRSVSSRVFTLAALTEVRVLRDAPQVRLDRVTTVGQGHQRPALKKQAADFALQRGDGGGQRWLRNTAALGGLGEAT